MDPLHNQNIQIYNFTPSSNHICLVPKELTSENFFKKYIFDPRSADLKPLDRWKAVCITSLLFVCTLGFLHLGIYLGKAYYAPKKSDAVVAEFGLHRLRGPSGPKTDIEGVSAAHLDAVQATMDKRKIPLQVFPKRPDREYAPNRQKAQEFVAKIPTAHQPAMQKAVDSIQHISMQMFDAALADCVKELDHQLNNTSYSVGLACGKSYQWVSSLALKTLQNLPTSWYSLPDQGVFGITGVPRIEGNAIYVKEKTVVLFDDVSYSGRQIRSNVSGILSEKPGTHVFVVVPFMSQLAIDGLQQVGHSMKGRVTVITTNRRVETLPTLFTPEEQEILTKYEKYGSGSFKDPRLTLTYTDWRYPDAWSFVTGFGSNRTAYRDESGERHELTPDQYFLPTSESIERPYGIEGIS